MRKFIQVVPQLLVLSFTLLGLNRAVAADPAPSFDDRLAMVEMNGVSCNWVDDNGKKVGAPAPLDKVAASHIFVVGVHKDAKALCQGHIACSSGTGVELTAKDLGDGASKNMVVCAMGSNSCADAKGCATTFLRSHVDLMSAAVKNPAGPASATAVPSTDHSGDGVN